MASPKIATGTPKTTDCGEEVTLAQLISPVSVHTRAWGAKWVIVR